MPRIDFHPPDHYPGCGLTFVVIGARYRDKWLFIRHRHRKSYELPAGHIGKGEEADIAASRELAEETGATVFRIECISTYTVREDASIRAGRLYFAEIKTMGQQRDESEIEDFLLSSSLPSDLGFPYVQSVLFDYLEAYRAGVR